MGGDFRESVGSGRVRWRCHGEAEVEDALPALVAIGEITAHELGESTGDRESQPE